MSKYRKRPIVVDAEQFEPTRKPWPEGVEQPERINGSLVIGLVNGEERYWIQTLEGWYEVSPGDWIITGVEGERYPCKPSIFDTTYAPVEAT